MSDTRVIDADGHVVEIGTTFRDFLDEPYRTRSRHYESELALVPTDGFDRNLGDKFKKSAVARLADGSMRSTSVGSSSQFCTHRLDSIWASHVIPTSPWPFVAPTTSGCMKSSAPTAKVACSEHACCLLTIRPKLPRELRRVSAETDFVAAMLPADGPYLLGHRDFDPCTRPRLRAI